MVYKKDLRDIIFKSVMHKSISAEIRAQARGLLCGTHDALGAGRDLKLRVGDMLAEGARLAPGTRVMTFSGSPKQVLKAEEVLIGLMAKPSGVATMADRFVRKAGGSTRVVAGAWKKLPPSFKSAVRRAAAIGGARPRIVDGPFVYLDKNYTAIFGGIGETLKSVAGLADHVKVIQIRGGHKKIAEEARDAVKYGADVLFVDTGNIGDITVVADSLTVMGRRAGVRIAFGGGIRLKDMDELLSLDVDVLDIGRAILDAPLLDMRMEVIKVT
jgi:nicotinate-nucleotide pyrophosphorylase (carboxylating)